jgi:ABC-type branched-subunit amino acid transport system ATPase component/branched-subunit amino acid ABC-type transport system permease component
MQQLLNLTITGAVSGAIFSLIACSLVLSYSASGIFNLSFGAIAYLSAFLYFELTAGLHWPVGIAGPFVILIVAPLFGWGLNRAIFRRLASASESAKIMATVGLLVALPALGRWVVERLVEDAHVTIPLGDQVYSIPGLGPTPRKVYDLPFDTQLNSDQLIVFIAAAVVALGLWVLLRRTRLGLDMRAQVDRPALAGFRGIDGDRTLSITWMLSTGLAALAGVVGAPVLNSLDPATYNVVLFVGASAAVLGGLRSMPRAFLGGLVLGVAQNLVLTYADFAKGISGFNASVPFVLLLGGLLWMGRSGPRRAGLTADAAPPPDPAADLPQWRRLLPWTIATIGLVVYVMFVANAFWIGLVARGLCLSLVFLSFVIVSGMGGMVSLAQATFVTMSSLVLGYLLSHDVPYAVAILAGVLAAVVLGVLVALPALRLDGLSLALATLALAFLGDRVLFAWDPFRNGSTGWRVPRLKVGPIDLADDRTMAMVVLVMILVVVWMIGNLQRSPNGRAMLAVRSSQPAAATTGVSPAGSKLKLFGLSAAIAGIGGVMLAMFNQSASSSSTRAEAGLLWLATVVLFGIRRPAGAVLAGLAVVISPQIWQEFSIFGWHGHQSSWFPSILFGLGAVSLAKNPEGMISVTALQNAERRARRAAKRAAKAVPTLAPAGGVALAGLGPDVGSEPQQTAGADAPVAAVAEVGRPDGSNAALAAVGFSTGYGQLAVIREVDVDLAAGSIAALLGANGAGKSTLCMGLAGGLPAQGGAVWLDGVDVTARPAHWRARHGLVLAPESRGVFPSLTVEENLSVWLHARAEVDATFQRFPALAQRRSIPAGNLSGGEQQLLTLAPLLVRPPRVLIADEPTLGLAPLVVQNLLELFRALRDEGVAVLLVEEKVRSLLELADVVSLLQLGKIVWTGDPAAVDDAELAAAYLGAAR